MIIKKLTLITISLLVCSCGSDDSSETSQKSKGNEAYLVNSLSELDDCNEGIQGALRYVASEKTFYHCSSSNWLEIDIQGKAGEKGEKGEKGDKGDIGEKGDKGNDGETIVMESEPQNIETQTIVIEKEVPIPTNTWISPVTNDRYLLFNMKGLDVSHETLVCPEGTELPQLDSEYSEYTGGGFSKEILGASLYFSLNGFAGFVYGKGVLGNEGASYDGHEYIMYYEHGQAKPLIDRDNDGLFNNLEVNNRYVLCKLIL